MKKTSYLILIALFLQGCAEANYNAKKSSPQAPLVTASPAPATPTTVEPASVAPVAPVAPSETMPLMPAPKPKPKPNPKPRLPAKKFAHLDILFVMDTSRSFDRERALIARSLSAFTNKFRGGDVRAGVLLAHAPGSTVLVKGEALADTGTSFRWNGERINVSPHQSLLRVNKWDPEIMVGYKNLDSVLPAKFLAVQDASEYAREQNDTYGESVQSTRGQSGLMSLHHVLSEPENLRSLRIQSFFRDNTPLAIIFLSNSDDEMAAEFDVSPAGVLQALQDLKKPSSLILTGLLPTSAPNYQELIRSNRGLTVPLGAPYGVKLEKIADFILGQI